MIGNKHFYKIVFFICFVNIVCGKHLPAFIKKCKFTTDGKALGECIKNVAHENREQFLRGIPEMHIPVLDPYVIDKIDFNTGNGTAVNVNAVFSNIKIQGVKDIIIDVIDIDMEDLKTKMAVHIPQLYITSDYTLNGRFMIIPINGSGHANCNFTNVQGTTEISGKFETRNNKKYAEWSDQKVKLKVDGGHFYFDDLFNGNKELTESTNAVINENADVVIQELKPMVEGILSSITFSSVKKVFRTFSIEELFDMD